MSPTCEDVSCFVGDHNPDNKFTGWYYKSDETFAGQPVWKQVENDGITLIYDETWVYSQF